MIDVQDWGRIDFHEAWRRQHEVVDAILLGGHPDTLVVCEHDPVITFGRLTREGSLVASEQELRNSGISVVPIDRGGEATVHGPGQLVGYPLFNLTHFKQDLHWFLRTIEQCIIDALGEFGIDSGRVEGLTGVWIQGDRKICAIGIHCKRWVTSHGFALNVDNDLGLFNTIVPCGITDKRVTSISMELGPKDPPVTLEAVKSVVSKKFQENFLRL